jgi:hypothetical protein
MIAATALPPAASNVIVYAFTVHVAVIVTSAAGIVAGISALHPAKV